MATATPPRHSRRATYGYDQRIEVHGALGAATAENQRPCMIEAATAAGYTRPPLHDFFMTRYTGPMPPKLPLSSSPRRERPRGPGQTSKVWPGFAVKPFHLVNF